MNGTPKLEILYYQGYDLLEIQPSGSVLSPAEFEWVQEPGLIVDAINNVVIEPNGTVTPFESTD